MSSRQKRSSGGYGLRKKAAKKKLDDDFEYYFSKMNVPLPSATPSKPVKQQRESKYNEEVGVMSKDTSPAYHREKPRSEEILSPRKPRGRPRKRPLEEGVMTIQSPTHIYASQVKTEEIKIKKMPKAKPIIQSEEAETDEPYAPENIVETVVVECMQEDERQDCEKDPLEDEIHRVKYDPGNIKIERDMREEHMLVEEVVPMTVTVSEEHERDGEKENQPQVVVEESVIIQTGSDPEEMIVKLTPSNHHLDDEGELDEGEDPDIEELIVKSSTHPRQRRKYKRPRLSHATIARLSQLNPEDKIECNECHKLLKPSSFRQHLRTHTGIKPFGCEVCEARFTRKGDVERHVRIVHHKQKPFKCCRCQRAFGDKKNLRWHLMNHDKKLFYVCEVCGFKFGKREYWENHVRFIHPIQLDVAGLVGEEGVEEDEEGMEGGRTQLAHGRIGVIIGEDEGEVDDPLGNDNEEEEQAAAVSNIRVSSYSMNDGVEMDDVSYLQNEIDRNRKLKGVTMITSRGNQRNNQQHVVKLNVGDLASSNSQKGSIIRRVVSMADLVQMTTRTTGGMSSGEDKGTNEYALPDQEHGIQAVVIRFDEEGGVLEDGQSTPRHHIVASSEDVGEEDGRNGNLIHVYSAGPTDPVVIDTQDYVQECELSSSDGKGATLEVQEVSNESNVVEVRVSGEVDSGEGGNGPKCQVVESVVHKLDEHSLDEKGSPPKVISIVLKGDEESGLIGRGPSSDANQAVQTLIEALLDAAKDDGQRPGLGESVATSGDIPKNT